MAIVVFGSINMDLVVRSARLPVAGETITGYSFGTAPGGKGANQAVASARLGMHTRMIGRVGADDFGVSLTEGLRSAGVDISKIVVDLTEPTGVALIAVGERGENAIIVVPGANGAIDQPDLERLEQSLEDACLLLLQLEVPLNQVIAAAEAAHQRGITVIIDPAPARVLPPRIYALADILTPNETEAAALVGFSLDTLSDVELAASILLDRGARAVVIKLGERGAYTADRRGGRFWPPFVVEPVDTVGAGDAFNAAMAVALAEGLSFEQAVRWGVAAGALAVTRPGAQSAMPSREELLLLMQNIPPE